MFLFNHKLFDIKIQSFPSMHALIVEFQVLTLGNATIGLAVSFHGTADIISV